MGRDPRRPHLDFVPLVATVIALAVIYGLGRQAVFLRAQRNKEPVPSDNRQQWAYPSGVIVTSDGGRLKLRRQLPEPKASSAVTEGETEQGGKTDRGVLSPSAELAAFSRTLTADFESCLAAYRAQSPPGQNGSSRFALSLEFTVEPTGQFKDLVLTRLGGSAPLPGCADLAYKWLAQQHVAPPKEALPIQARLELNAIVLTDDEAKGRGYRYIEAEQNWERALREHREWFACKKDEDCQLSGAGCEVRAVAKGHLADFEAASKTRLRPGCLGSTETAAYSARCRNRRCRALER